MSDERLLSEALRAHAAGGVSTPRTEGSPTAGSPGPDTGGASTSGRRRFRPLGRVRRDDQAAQPEQARAGQTRTDQTRADQTRADQTRADQTRPDQPQQARVDPSAPDRSSRPDVPAPRSGGPGLPPPGYGRGPMPPAPPTAPVRPGLVAGGFGATTGPRTYAPPSRGGAPLPSPQPAAASAGYVPWSAVTVTWWSLVAVLAGGVVGGAIGVLSLLLPA